MKYLIKTSKDFQDLLNNYRNKKILIITGKNSFNKSGAEEIFKKLQTKNLSFFFQEIKYSGNRRIKKDYKFNKKIQTKLYFLCGWRSSDGFSKNI